MRSTRDPLEAQPGLVLQHGVDGPPARLGEWLRERGIPFVIHHSGQGSPPSPEGHAFVVSLGSDESATAETPAWIPAELQALRAAVAQEIPVLGLCFGAQALSVVLGGGIDPLDRPEIGWLAIDTVDPKLPAGPWLQYHFEQMRIPPGAEELARSPAGAAAFRLGPHLGVQFHPEADTELVRRWALIDPKLPALGLTPEELAAESEIHAREAREQAFQLFDSWFAAARLRPGSLQMSRARR